jgi:excisionase family DNA binding protein
MTVEFYTVDEVAAITKTSRATIYRMIRRKEIVPRKFGSATRIHRSQFIPQAQTNSGVNSGVNVK